jgi:DNA modification methylase
MRLAVKREKHRHKPENPISEITGKLEALSYLDETRPPKIIKKPYTENISAGKNSYVYDAHTYHTKVPPQGIAQLILYYTNPGDVILDPFCGSGMTGVAATELDRVAILSDLSPAAAFIAYNLNTPIGHAKYMDAVREILQGAKELEMHLYGTTCKVTGIRTPILYMVWSYGLICNHCEKEFIIWNVARDERESIRESKIKKEFECPHCGANLRKRALKRTKRYPVQVGYKVSRGMKETTADPSPEDIDLLKRIEFEGIPQDLWFPQNKFQAGINTKQPIAAGIDTVDKAYTTRALYTMAYLWDAANKWPDKEIRQKLLFTITSLYQRITLFSEFRFWGGSGNTANYNVPQIINEQNVFKTFERKAKTISWYFRDAPPHKRLVSVMVESACNLPMIKDKSVDYIFTDPPFGGNINYSEMNFLWESWLQVHTDNTEEAIINSVQGKSDKEYQAIMCSAFKQMRRVLKDKSWLTVVFHNSSNKVWEALQNALTLSGFEIVGTQTFDKKHGTFKMFVSDNAVGYDLVLHCRKAAENTRSQYGHEEKIDAESHVINFIREHIKTGVYLTNYLHVKRQSEFDYRKLYAEWLSESVTNTIVTLDFETFRGLAKTTIEETLSA